MSRNKPLLGYFNFLFGHQFEDDKMSKLTVDIHKIRHQKSGIISQKRTTIADYKVYKTMIKYYYVKNDFCQAFNNHRFYYFFVMNNFCPKILNN